MQALLVCLVIVCIVELWDELQVALMLTALMLGMWSLQRYNVCPCLTSPVARMKPVMLAICFFN